MPDPASHSPIILPAIADARACAGVDAEIRAAYDGAPGAIRLDASGVVEVSGALIQLIEAHAIYAGDRGFTLAITSPTDMIIEAYQTLGLYAELMRRID